MPKIVDHEAYRQDLLQRATPLFLQYGFEALTTRQLSRHLGVSTGTLYHYFSNKEQLFECLARQWMEADMSWVREIFRAIPDRQERIRQVGRFLAQNRAKFDTQNQLVLQFCRLQQQRGIDMAPFWDDICASWDRLTREMLELHSDFAAELMGKVIDGIFMQWFQGGQNLDLEDFFARLAYWLPLIDQKEQQKNGQAS